MKKKVGKLSFEDSENPIKVTVSFLSNIVKKFNNVNLSNLTFDKTKRFKNLSL